ncbi:MAG: hypothetical protein J7K73_04180 [Nanoarchaeota archaeon]|nr:hypothetical protein [Nanoarchaeota archaeon]
MVHLVKDTNYRVEFISSARAAGYYITYIPKTPEINDLNGLLVKRYDESGNVIFSIVGLRTYPSVIDSPRLKFPTIQRGYLICNEDDLLTAFGDELDGIIIHTPIVGDQLKYLTIVANQILSELEKEIKCA